MSRSCAALRVLVTFAVVASLSQHCRHDVVGRESRQLMSDDNVSRCYSDDEFRYSV